MSERSGAFLSVEEASFSYERIDGRKGNAISNLTLEFREGEFAAVIGQNGSGKSTLARLLVGLLHPSSGLVRIGELDSDSRDFLPEIRKRLGFAFQNPEDQMVRSSVDEDVAFGPGNEGLGSAELDIRVNESLELVGASSLKKRDTRTLSGGERQKVAIAGVLARRPECLILDEPTSMLDPIARENILEILEKLNRELGITLILITQSMEEAVFADRVIVLDRGTLVMEGSPEKVFREGETLRGIGLDLPFYYDIAERLRLLGLPVSGHRGSIADLAEAICSSNSTR